MKPARHPSARSGQSLIESLLVIALLSLIFWGVFQLSQLQAAKAVLTYAASAGARARAVGLDDFMVSKVIRAAAIPNAGAMVTPQKPEGSAGGAAWGDYTPGEAWAIGLASRPGSPQLNLERSRIPLFLGSQRWGEMAAILDYERWDDVRYGQGAAAPELVRMHTHQDYPLNYPFARAFYAADEVRLDSAGDENDVYVTRDQHYPLYLEVP